MFCSIGNIIMIYRRPIYEPNTIMRENMIEARYLVISLLYAIPHFSLFVTT